MAATFACRRGVSEDEIKLVDEEDEEEELELKVETISQLPS